MTTVCILYGFAEGEKVSKRFRTILASRGYQIIKDPSKADIIIGHSGGCFLLPEKIRAKHIIQIGIVHWPGRGVADSMLRKLISDLKHHHKTGAIGFWARKTFWNAVYIWKIPSMIRMLIGRKRGYHWRHGDITTVVRPQMDSFCTPNFDLMPFVGKPHFIEIPGQHDDCWRQPEDYISIVQSDHGTRVLVTSVGQEAAISGVRVEPA